MGLTEESFEYISRFDDIKNILRRANKHCGEFIVATTTKGTVEWRTLPLEHEIVKSFLEKNRRGRWYYLHGFPLINLGHWVAGDERTEDEDSDDDSDRKVEDVETNDK